MVGGVAWMRGCWLLPRSSCASQAHADKKKPGLFDFDVPEASLSVRTRRGQGHLARHAGPDARRGGEGRGARHQGADLRRQRLPQRHPALADEGAGADRAHQRRRAAGVQRCASRSTASRSGTSPTSACRCRRCSTACARSTARPTSIWSWRSRRRCRASRRRSTPSGRRRCSARHFLMRGMDDEQEALAIDREFKLLSPKSGGSSTAAARRTRRSWSSCTSGGTRWACCTTKKRPTS